MSKVINKKKQLVSNEDFKVEDYKPNFKVKKLPQTFKDDWIGSLRNGNYKQIDGELFNKHIVNKEKTNCYCVMGVAGNISNVPEKEMQEECVLSELDKKLISKVPKELWNAEQYFMELNDEKKLTFSQIADIIEKYF